MHNRYLTGTSVLKALSCGKMTSSSPTAVSGVGGDSNIVQTTGDDVSFTVGDQFMSFDSLQSRIKKYELVNFTQHCGPTERYIMKYMYVLNVMYTSIL